MQPHKTKALVLLSLAGLCALMGFVSLFLGHTNIPVALGLAVLLFVMFGYLFNAGYDLWFQDQETEKNQG